MVTWPFAAQQAGEAGNYSLDTPGLGDKRGSAVNVGSYHMTPSATYIYNFVNRKDKEMIASGVRLDVEIYV